MEWGNLVFIGLVIAQILSEKPFKPLAAILGLAALGAAYYFADQIMKGGGQQ